MCSDGEGALNRDAAKDVLKSGGTGFWIRARGQRAAAIEAGKCVLRATMRAMEADLERRDIPLNSKRLPVETLFVCDAFTLYNAMPPGHVQLSATCLGEAEFSRRRQPLNNGPTSRWPARSAY